MFDSDAINHAEYAYTKKKEGRLLLGAVLLVLLYILFVIAFFLLCYISGLIPLYAMTPAFLWILVHYTWCFVSYDIVYTFASGSLCFYRQNGKKRHPLLTLRVQEAESVCDGRTPAEERASAEGRFLDLSSSARAESTLLLRAVHDGEPISALFDATPRVRDLMEKFCPRTYFVNKK